MGDNMFEDYNEEKENRKLLRTYLIKHYGFDTAKKIMVENYNHLFDYHGVAWALGKIDFEFFCKYFLQDTFMPKPNNTARNLAPVHIEVWHELQQMFIKDKWDKEEFILPRGCSKSTIINKANTCHSHCYKLSRYTVVMGNKESDAVEFISDTRMMISNRYIVKAFGKLIDKSNRDLTLNKQEIELTNCTKIQAFSLGSSIRGTTFGCEEGIFRPSCIILDDILKRDDILSDGAKEKIVNAYYNDIAQAGDTEVIRNGVKIKPSTKFLIIGTPLAADDFINTIKNDPTFKVFHRPIVDFKPDEYFENNKYWQHYNDILRDDKLSKEDKQDKLAEYYSENKTNMEFPTIWEKYRCDIDVAQVYFVARTSFMQELMCDCQSIGQKWFKSPVRTMDIKEILSHNLSKTMLCVDPASTAKQSSDYHAFCVGSQADNDFIYARKCIICKPSYNEYCQKVVDLLAEYPEITYCYIEKNTYNGADIIKINELIKNDNRFNGRNIIFINEMQKKNKDDKIFSIVDDVNSGKIIFNEEDKDAIKQITDFAGQNFSLHDDMPDCLSELVTRIKDLPCICKVKIFDRRLLGV